MTSEMAPNPYAEDLGGREPLDALAETPQRIRQLVESWPDSRLAKSYAPGKWTASQILIHLAQTELALTARARFAVSQQNYQAQAFSQDDWMPVDANAGGRIALAAYTALRQLNLAMWQSLTPEQRARRFHHPEYGILSVWWIAAQMAGHDIHHWKQLARIE